MHEWKTDYRNLDAQREALQRLALEYFSDLGMIEKALELAERAHATQKRDDGDPYVIHPIRAARFLMEEMDEHNSDVVVAALLHDVVEDTTVTLEEVRDQFGGTVAALVDSVTRPRAATEIEEEKRTSKPLMYQHTIEHGSQETIRIKAADIVDNMRSWEVFEELIRSNPVRLHRWKDEAKNYYFVIGARAGHGIDVEMRRIATIFE